MKRLIILTTPTSGTSSLWRMANNFIPQSWPRSWFINECLERGVAFDDIKNQKLPEEGCFLFNQPHLFNFDQDFSETRFLLNFRDPRDMSCNQYYWIFSHPYPHLTEQEIENKKQKVREDGIDSYVLSLDHRQLFSTHLAFHRNDDLISKCDAVSYAQLCLDTDNAVQKLASIFGFDDHEKIESIKKAEHPSNLAVAQEWIGGRWEGADFFPGRARVELRQDTYKKLTERYSEILSCLADLDDPKFNYFYGK